MNSPQSKGSPQNSSDLVQSGHRKPSDIALAFLTGTCLALIQFSYFFLLEAYVSSTSLSFFAALLFWLIGFLAGMNLRSPAIFPRLMVVGVLAYYIALLLARTFPYNYAVLPPIAACVAVSGMAAGCFFPYARHRFQKVKYLLFHENNGFIVGIFASLLGAIYAGKILLGLAPLVGGLLVFLVMLYQRLAPIRAPTLESRKELPQTPQLAGRNVFPFFISGIYFGLLQVSIFFTIQVFVTASFAGYFVVVLAWMLGVILNLKTAFPRSLSAAMLVSIGSYYALLVVSSAFTSYVVLLPCITILVLLSAAPAGAFFRELSRNVSGHSLFFHENNGFVLGYLLAMFGFINSGQNFLHWAPLLAFAAAMLGQNRRFSLAYASILLSAILSLQIDSLGMFWTLAVAAVVGGFSFRCRPRACGEIEAPRSTGAVSTLAMPHWILKSVLFIAGFNLLHLQYLITREFSSILAASEVTILIVGTSYFAGYSVGYGVSRYVTLKFLRVAGPAMFAFHLAVLPFVKASAGRLIGAGYGLGVLVALIFVASFCTSAFYSVLLPNFIERMGAKHLTSAYAWDLSGAVAGVFVMFLLVWTAPQTVLPLYFLMLLLLVTLLLWKTRWRRLVYAAGFVPILLISLYQGELGTFSTEEYYRSRHYDNPQLLFSGNSFYHSVEVIDTFHDPARTRPKARVSFLNGVRYFDYAYDSNGNFSTSTGLSEFTYFLAELPAKYLYEKKGRKLRVLILGAGSMYSLSRVSEFSERTTMVEIDQLVVESAKACWSHFNQLDKLDNYEIVIDDAKHYLRTTPEKFDLIINDISAPYYIGTVLLHSREFYELAKSRLKPGGIFAESTQGRPRSGDVDSQGMKILKGVAETFRRFRMVETRSQHRKKSGYIYASDTFRFATADLKAVMKKDRMYGGTRIHSTVCSHFNLDRVTPFSLDNMETLLSRNTFRMRNRLGLDDD